MNLYKPDKIRNIALVGHGHSGKTSLAEALLFVSKAISRLGKIEENNTTCDYDPDEIKRKISISAALAPCEYNGYKINVIDTPGYADFIGELIAALRVVEAVVLTVDAVSGVQVQTEKAWQLAQENNLPVFIFINRLDKEHADFDKTVADLQEAFGAKAIPLMLPIGAESSFKGLADILNNKAYLYANEQVKEENLPSELAEQTAAYQEKLMETVAESDDALIEKYLETGELSTEEIKSGLGKAVASRNLVPIIPGSAVKTIGARELLSLVINCCPHPLSKGEVAGEDLKTKQQGKHRLAEDAPLLAYVFKTLSDPYVGRLNYIKVFAGNFKADSQVLNASKQKKERVGHVFFMRGKNQEETKIIPTGDLGAVPKLAETLAGDSLTDESSPFILPPVAFPEPLAALAVNPKTKGDEEKLTTALAKIAEEDPTLRFGRDPVTKEHVLAGVGDLHLEVTLEKLHRRYGVEAVTSLPKIPYKETIKGTAKGQGKYKKQTGGRGQYGDVWLELKPLPRGQGFEFVDKIVGGVVPRNFIPAVEKGVKEVLETGVMTNYPVVDVQVTLYDGSYHPVDSSEMAFKIAASMAFKKCFLEAKPVLLEPIYNLQIMVPEANMGDVMGDLSSKRGKIQGMESKGKWELIKAQVPLAEVQRYATELRSITGGRGSFSMSFSHYEEVPPDIAQKVIAAAAKKEE